MIVMIKNILLINNDLSNNFLVKARNNKSHKTNSLQKVDTTKRWSQKSPVENNNKTFSMVISLTI